LTYTGGIGASILIDASWGVLLYQADYFLNPSSRWWYSDLPEIRYSFTIAIFIFLGYFIHKSKYTKNKIFSVPQTKWIILNALYFLLTTLWAVWSFIHNQTLISHLKLLLFLYIAFRVIDNSDKFEKMIWAFLCGNFYLGWVAHSTGRLFGDRLEAFGPADTGGDGNATASVMISCIPILLFYLLEGKRWQKIASLGFMAYVIDGVILVNSRGALVGMIVSTAYFAFLLLFGSKGVSAKKRMAIVFVLIIGFSAFIYLTDESFWNRMSTISDEAKSDRGGGGRMFFWKKALDLAKEHPLGVGVWGYQYLSPQFIPEELLARGPKGGRRAVHSLFFQCLAERGYIGILLFISLLISNFRFIWKTKKSLKLRKDFYHYYQASAIEAGFIAFLAASVFLNNLYMEVLYWFMLYFALFGTIFSEFRNQEAKNEKQMI